MKPTPTPAADRPPRVVVAGVGLVSPLGLGAWPTFSALLAGRTVADRLDKLEPDTPAVALAQAVGGIAAVRHTATDPVVDLAERAAREAAAEAGVGLAGLPTWVGTSKGAVCGISDWGCRIERTSSLSKPSDLGQTELPRRLVESVTLGPHGYLSHHLTQRTGIQVRRHTVAACASSLTALHQARLALLGPKSDGSDSERVRSIPNPQSALVVTAESALLPLFVHSYRRLGVLAPLNVDGYRARPLDEGRCGFVLGEVGAAVLLRRLDPGDTFPKGAIELVDSAVACEAEDLIRPSRSMQALGVVASQLVAGRPIAAVHPHAPGTAEHDAAELRLLGDVLRQRQHPFHEEHHAGPTPTAVYASKGALGHTLGAAGLVSFVIACLSARTGKLPPMPWLETPLRGAPMPLSATPTLPAGDRRGHLVVAAGFGGHVAGALVRRAS
ncbi:MAG: beta-ketoacyl synthase N-terminal-like domain-containing protein [Planctomycetota bacterium]